jgi:hypothetical protein
MSTNHKGVIQMKRTAPALLAAALFALALVPAQASAAFGLKGLDVAFTNQDGTAATQAGSHPFAMRTSLAVNTAPTSEGLVFPEGEIRDLTIAQIPGFVGSQTAVPTCSFAEFASRFEGRPSCPDATAVGYSAVEAEFAAIPDSSEDTFFHVPLYNLSPPPGAAARLGFVVLNVPVTIDVTVSEEKPHNLVARLRNIPQAILFYRSRTTLWGVPASPAHDSLRGDCLGRIAETDPQPVSLGKCPVNVSERAFLTLPRSCKGPLATVFSATSWLGESSTGQALTNDGVAPRGMSECASLPFAATLAAKPTTLAATSASGLDVSLQVKDEGLTSPSGRAQADVSAVTVTLPEGMTANPSSAAGLEVCTEAQLAEETLASQGCPDAAKLGTLEVKTPLLAEPVPGALYLAEPYRNPFGTLIALQMVIKSPGLGILITQPVKVEPDPRTGQLVSTVTEIPELPFSSFTLHFREGARSPLVSPPACGAHTVRATITPSSGGAPIQSDSAFQIQSGPGGAPCPQGGVPPFSPGFSAGTLNNAAGAHSPLLMRLTRTDGDQDLTKLSTSLPGGLLAKLAGTTQCPEAAIAQARARSGPEDGALELASPSCPASSRIGRALAGAGVGSVLTYVPGSLYLAGPYNGAPLSVVAIVPAVAGPFDLGVVVTRMALNLDPRSAAVSVDGSASDPIPHILAGIPLKVRDIRVYVDRPQFTLNPTSCDPGQIGATLWGGGADPFASADDIPHLLSERFQAAGCASLPFKPRLGIALKGATGHGGHPALTGTFRPRPGNANLEHLVVRLPRSAFLDQGHIRTICTRVQFAADACPPGSIYGRATVHSPLLEEPLSGPVYLRSSDNELPDMVLALRGLIEVEAVARIDSVKGGIRATFTDLPDAPLTKAVVQMQGAKKGLIENSADLCKGARRARVSLTAQNAKRAKLRPVIGVRCPKR